MYSHYRKLLSRRKVRSANAVLAGRNQMFLQELEEITELPQEISGSYRNSSGTRKEARVLPTVQQANSYHGKLCVCVCDIYFK